MKRHILSPEVKQDVRDIRKYYLEKAGSRVARRVVEEIDRACQFLGDVPGAGHSRQDLTDAPVKFWQVFAYFIIYDPSVQPVGIARVLHTSRDLETLLRNTPPRV